MKRMHHKLAVYMYEAVPSGMHQSKCVTNGKDARQTG
jgi:hypothetical protein